MRPERQESGADALTRANRWLRLDVSAGLPNVSGLPLCMDKATRRYLAEIGRRGGRASRRTLDADTARAMVRVREAGRAYRRYHAACFWSYDPELEIGVGDVEWVARTLMKHGNREAWELGKRLCR